MASFAARRSPSALWTIKECAHFAALKEFELLQLLSRDKKAFATARHLSLYSSQPQPQPPSRASAASGRDTSPPEPAAVAAPGPRRQ
jgi:hypothetical protein